MSCLGSLPIPAHVVVVAIVAAVVVVQVVVVQLSCLFVVVRVLRET